MLFVISACFESMSYALCPWSIFVLRNCSEASKNSAAYGYGPELELEIDGRKGKDGIGLVQNRV